MPQDDAAAALRRYRRRIAELERCVTEAAAAAAAKQAAVDCEVHATRAAEAEAARLRGEVRKYQVRPPSLGAS